MPRPLRTAPPSSAIARLLDNTAARGSIAPVAVPMVAASATPTRRGTQGFRPPQHSPQPPTGEPARIKRELVLTPAADRTLADMLAVFRLATGTKLTHSHLARAIMRFLADHFTAIERHAATLPPLRLPSNAPGHEAERDQFEQALAEVLAKAIQH